MKYQLKKSTAFANADDRAIIVANKSLKTATNTLQNEFNIITKWCHDSGLIVNSSKTKIMNMRPTRTPKSNI